MRLHAGGGAAQWVVAVDKRTGLLARVDIYQRSRLEYVLSFVKYREIDGGGSYPQTIILESISGQGPPPGKYRLVLLDIVREKM